MLRVRQTVTKDKHIHQLRCS